jgi:hypothetical protein
MMRRLDAACQLRPRYGALPLIRKLTDSRKLPIGGPDAPTGPLFGAKCLDMGRHIREADDCLLRIPDGERATHERTLDQESIAYQPLSSFQVWKQAPIRDVHRKQLPRIFQQETFNRSRWLLTTGIYTLACLATSSLLGALLSSVGFLLHQASASASLATPVFAGGSVLVGMLAITYTFGDAGLIRLPRPSLMRAVPVTWWRWWSPYGAALGLGVTTYIEFGAFYILCLWYVLKGEPAYGAVLMGTYGLARALVLLPLSWCAYRDGGNSQTYFSRLVNQLGNAKLVVAVVLILFGTYILFSTVL